MKKRLNEIKTEYIHSATSKEKFDVKIQLFDQIDEHCQITIFI